MLVSMTTPAPAELAEEYAEWVLRCAEAVPAGRVTTYSSIAQAVGVVLGRGGPRQVGAVMAREGSAVPWWRVVRADGTLPEAIAGRAGEEYRLERTPLRPDGRVDLAKAFVVAGLTDHPAERLGGNPSSLEH